MAETIKYISLENLQLNDTLLFDKIDAGDAKSLKTVALSDDGTKLVFYRESEPVGSSNPAYEIELPDIDLTGVMSKVVNALKGNIAVFDESGGVTDSGINIDDIVTGTKLEEAIAQAKAETNHLTKEIVTTLPSVENAKANCIYMIKNESITAGDAYEEWMLVGNELVCIGSTQTDLSGYYTSEQIDDKISSAKSEAISDATSQAASDATTKANQALIDAKAYTDSEIGKVNTKVESNTTAIEAATSNITTINTTLNSQGDRITALENGMIDIKVADPQDIYDIFGLTAPTP